MGVGKHTSVGPLLELGIRKVARHCGAMRIFKSKCTKHTSFRALYEVGMRKNGTPLWREAHVHVKMHKTHQRRTTCASWDRKKWHAILARNKFSSQKIQNTPASEHFMKLGCGKMARRCGAKHICKSKRTKHTSFGPLLEVCMWKTGTPLRREAQCGS